MNVMYFTYFPCFVGSTKTISISQFHDENMRGTISDWYNILNPAYILQVISKLVFTSKELV